MSRNIFQKSWLTVTHVYTDFPGGASGKEPVCQSRRYKRFRLSPWVGKIPWRRAWQPTPAFLSGESHGQRSLVGYSPWCCKESNTTEATKHACTHTFVYSRISPVSSDHLGNEILVEGLKRLAIKLLKDFWSLGSTEDRCHFIPPVKFFVLFTPLTEAIRKHIIHWAFRLSTITLIQVLIVWNCTGI